MLKTLFETFQVVDTHHLHPRRRVGHDKIPEAEVLLHGVAQILRERLGILVEKDVARFPHLIAIFGFRAFHDYGQERILLPDHRGELNPAPGFFLRGEI